MLFAVARNRSAMLFAVARNRSEVHIFYHRSIK